MSTLPIWEQSLVRARYRIVEPIRKAAPSEGGVGFEDGLSGSGQPVSNVLTVAGRTEKPVHLIPLVLEREAAGAGPSETPFRRGDANDDGKVNIADAIWCVNELVRRGPPSPCLRAADADGDGHYNLTDAVAIIRWRFLHGPPPPAPWPACGLDESLSTLPCPLGAAASCP